MVIIQIKAEKSMRGGRWIKPENLSLKTMYI